MTVSSAVTGALEMQRAARASSPMIAYLSDVTLRDIESGGPCGTVLSKVDPKLEPILDAVTLRFLGAVHRIVLDGRAPELASHYPSAGGTFDPTTPDSTGAAFVEAVDAHVDELVAGLDRPVQTNEVGRCSSLLPGFLAVAAATGLPLRILEIGSSAGLNLRWDRYRYEGGRDGSAWGDRAAPLRFTDVYSEPGPDLAVPATVASRAGCDANPIDPTSPEGMLTLHSFVWPDQEERHAMLEAAVAAMGETEASVERVDAADWIEARLAEPAPGVATVVFHSIVWQYLTLATRRRISRAIDKAGRASSADAPVAWLRMEPGEDFAKSAEVRLTTWPGGVEALVARTGYHGRPVRVF